MVKRSGRITAPQLWLVMAKSYRVLRLRAEESIVSAGLCLTDFAALEALLHKGPLTITEIQQKVLLASGSMTAAIDRLRKWAWSRGCRVTATRGGAIVSSTEEGSQVANHGL